VDIIPNEKGCLSVTVTSEIPELCTDDEAYQTILIPIATVKTISARLSVEIERYAEYESTVTP
jgi:hypothetical protein